MNKEMKNTNYQDDQEFAGRIREAWGRPELSPAETARFDRALRERLAGSPKARRHWGLSAALAAAAAVTALVILVPVSNRTPSEGLSLLEVLGQAQEIAYGEVLSWESVPAAQENSSTAWTQDYDADAALNKMLRDEDQNLTFLLSPPQS
ncbi:MAG: hypothetical protein PHE84_13750 [bacterium]|nr:hypothetical protein [bacterium]